MANPGLLVSEIYTSIQGEAHYAGFPCTFVRLAGCSLRCRWCDTAHAFSDGVNRGLAEVLEEVTRLGVPLVELTGGEPLDQPAAIDLMGALLKAGHRVLLETGGARSIATVPRDVHVIMDVKCPGSGMADKMDLSNLAYLKTTDEVKFVLADRADFEWASRFIRDHKLTDKCRVLLSSAFGLLKPADLAGWILEAGLHQCRLQLQIHKYIWSPRARGV